MSSGTLQAQIPTATPLQPLLESGRRAWVWPLLAACVLGVLGWALNLAVERTMRKNIAAHLQTTLNADVTALELWLASQEQTASVIADEKTTRNLIARLTELGAKTNEPAALLQLPELHELRELLRPWMRRPQGQMPGTYDGFVLVDRQRRIVAADEDSVVLLKGRERSRPAALEQAVDRALAGQPTVSRPYTSTVVLTHEPGEPRPGAPTMCVFAPVRDQRGKIIAALGLRIRPEKDFTRILSVARAGDTGETYAFDDTGLLLSKSRFEESLKQIGLVDRSRNAQSILRLKLRDPLVDLTRGRRSSVPRSKLPLTRSVAAAITGQAGIDVTGYRDYRGVPSVGAWTWLGAHRMGIATEVDAAEAFRPLVILRWALWSLFSLLVASAAVIFASMRIAGRWKHEARGAALTARQLGQYTLDEKIGGGGMGVVYKAHHAMLRRPTAVKLLKPDEIDPASIVRFEREVQLTSRLNHPNTIAVYDYGRTPDGIFYYAMEYLDGLPLDLLVRRFGPQPEGRVIHILRQVCGSLAEAHGIGLIHRDIKPANIMINQRGGLHDYVKVLDFGLGKAVNADSRVTQTGGCFIAGTPEYLSPEAIQSPDEVDARSDLYSLGAVGYFLLTGTPVFTGQSMTEVCILHVRQQPETPSARLGRSIAPELEALLLDCLEKKPEDRPFSAEELRFALDRCSSAETWGQVEAQCWWASSNVGFATLAPTEAAETMHTAVTTMRDIDPLL